MKQLLDRIFRKNKNSVTNQQLHKIQIATTAVFVVLGGLSAGMMKYIGNPLSLSHQTKDELMGGVLAPANSVIAHISVRDLAVAMAVAVAIVSLLAITRWEKSYADQVKANTVWLRWVSVGISGALMIEILALLTGSSDLMHIKLMESLVLLSAYLGYRSEVNNADGKQIKWNAFGVSTVAGVLAWLTILVNLVATPVYGAAYSPWYVYVAVAIAVLGFKLTSLNQWQAIRRRSQGKQFLIVERNHWLILLASRASFLIVLIIGLKG